MAGVLVLHAWWGLNEDVRAYARRLAAEGFTVETPDLYGGGRTATEIPAAQALMKARDTGRAMAEIDRAAERLAKAGRFGVLGWSMGGSFAWDLVERRPGTVAALVDHYGGGEFKPGAQLPPILGHHGELDDDIVPLRDLDQKLRDAGQQHEFHYYPGAKHWFAEPSRPEYDPEAATLAWDRTVRFLHKHLGPPAG